MLFKIKKILFANAFGKNILILFIGTLISQIISFFAAPLLTHYYGADSFGTFELINKYLAFLVLLCTFRYEFAILLPKEDSNAQLLFNMIFFLTAIASLFIFILICFSNIAWVDKYFHLGSESLLLLIPAYLFLYAFNQVLTSWLNRMRNYVNQSIAKVAQSFFLIAFSVWFGYLGYGAMGLLLGTIIGTGISVIIISFKVYSVMDMFSAFKNWKETKSIALRYSDFPTVNMIHALTDSLQAIAFILLMTHYFDKTYVGYYAFGLRLVQTPLSLMSKSISQVYFQKAAQLHHNDTNLLIVSTNRMIRFICLLGIPLALFAMLVVPLAFKYFLGNEWHVAGKYIQILIPFLFLNFISAIISQLTLVKSQQKSHFLLSLINNSIYIVVIIIGGLYLKDFEKTVYLLSISLCVYFVFEIRWMLSLLKHTN